VGGILPNFIITCAEDIHSKVCRNTKTH